MKVILLEDVAKVGQKYETKEISNGYALNFLIPKGLAREATKSNLKTLEEKRRTHQQKRKTLEKEVVKSLGKLKGESLEIKAKANDKGHLFAGIHKDKIAEEVKNQTGVDLQSEMLEMEDPIKEVGEYKVMIKVENKATELKIKVEKE